MKKIIFEIPKEYHDSHFYPLLHVRHGQKVEKGDTIVTYFGYNDSSDWEYNRSNYKDKIPVYAECDGYYCVSDELFRDVTRKYGTHKSQLVGYIYESFDELYKAKHSISWHIADEPTKQYKKLYWQPFNFYRIVCTSYWRPEWKKRYDIELNVKNKRICLSFTYSVKSCYYKFDENIYWEEFYEEGVKLKKGDKIYLCSENKPFLELEVIQSPYAHTWKSYKTVDFFLLEEDVNTLLKHNLQEIVIEFKDGRKPVIVGHDLDNNFMSQLFHNYVEIFKNALTEMGFSFENKNANKSPIISDPCYVYLMCDTKNGFHKIGISKTPSYREKTLQSEKPSIDLICSKEYPSRKIAEAIEFALHKVYEENRIRGEWFDLSEEEVAMISATLK